MNYVQLIQQAIDFIQTHLASPLSLDEVGSDCHLSKFHFSHPVVSQHLAPHMPEQLLECLAIYPELMATDRLFETE